MAKAKKFINYITPVGIAVWPKLDKPDVYTPKKGEAKIRFKCSLAFEDDAVMHKVRDDIQDLIKENNLEVGKNTNEPVREEKDKEGNPTGRILLETFSGKDRKPLVVDSKNRNVPAALVGGGSKVRLNLTINPYDGFGGGVNLYLNGVQVIELVEKGANSARFDAAEGGFEYDGPEETEEKTGFEEKADLDDEIPF